MQRWWRNFDDPVLDQLVAEAQRVNPNVRIGGMRIMEARAQLGIADSTRYPQVQQATAQALGVSEQRSSGRNTNAWTANVGFNLGWEIDFWGKFRRSIESADAAYLASIAQYDDIQVLMAAQVAGLYCTIRTVELRLRSRARTRSCKGAASRSRSFTSGTATSPSWTSSRPRPSTWAPSRLCPRWRLRCARRRTP
jgi:outer membrane protein TolC